MKHVISFTPTHPNTLSINFARLWRKWSISFMRYDGINLTTGILSSSSLLLSITMRFSLLYCSNNQLFLSLLSYKIVKCDTWDKSKHFGIQWTRSHSFKKLENVPSVYWNVCSYIFLRGVCMIENFLSNSRLSPPSMIVLQILQFLYSPRYPLLFR